MTLNTFHLAGAGANVTLGMMALAILDGNVSHGNGKIQELSTDKEVRIQGFAVVVLGLNHFKENHQHFAWQFGSMVAQDTMQDPRH